jgi:hypothetical protein
MIRFISLFALAATLLTTGTAADVGGLAGTSWDIEGRLRIAIPRADYGTEWVTGSAVFAPSDNPGGEWCVVDLDWDEILQFVGTPRQNPTARWILDPGEVETLNSFENAFGDTIRDRLERRLRTESLDSVEPKIFVLVTSLRRYRKAGEYRLRVEIDALIRYTGWSGRRHARTQVRLTFNGSGPERSPS